MSQSKEDWIAECRGDSVDDFLHDAERAANGADFALMMGDRANAKLLTEKSAALLAEANRLDPDHLDPAWQETSPMAARSQTLEDEKP